MMCNYMSFSLLDFFEAYFSRLLLNQKVKAILFLMHCK